MMNRIHLHDAEDIPEADCYVCFNNAHLERHSWAKQRRVRVIIPCARVHGEEVLRIAKRSLSFVNPRMCYTTPQFYRGTIYVVSHIGRSDKRTKSISDLMQSETQTKEQMLISVWHALRLECLGLEPARGRTSLVSQIAKRWDWWGESWDIVRQFESVLRGEGLLY